MKKTLALFFTLLTALVSQAQISTGKQLVYVNSFESSCYISDAEVKAIEANIMQGLAESNRVLLKDFESDLEFQRELHERSQDASVSEKDYAFQLLNSRGAKYVIDGVVTHYNAVIKYYDDGSSYYSAMINVALQVTDVSTGLVIMTKVLSTEQSLTGIFTEKGSTIGNSRREALSNATVILIERAKTFAEECFKLEGYILEVDQVKKDEAKTVYINMGNATGVKKGDIFEVFEYKIVAGRKINKKVGEIKVEEVQGADISLCKVKNGGEEILKKIHTLEEGEKLTIISRMKKKPLGGLI